MAAHVPWQLCGAALPAAAATAAAAPPQLCEQRRLHPARPHPSPRPPSPQPTPALTPAHARPHPSPRPPAAAPQSFPGANVVFADVTDSSSIKRLAEENKIDVMVCCLASRTGAPLRQGHACTTHRLLLGGPRPRTCPPCDGSVVADGLGLEQKGAFAVAAPRGGGGGGGASGGGGAKGAP